MKTLIQQELEKRSQRDDDVYNLIGAEIKRRRVSQSQTLSSIAGDVCSVSYLCKVEKNQLKPNRHMLKEICKKLNMDSPKVNLLFQMRDMIVNAAIAYNNKDYETISNYYTKCISFDNYKTQLIEFIYYISQSKIKEASEVSYGLLKLLNVMGDAELNVFIIFYSILLYYEENYMEAVDNLLCTISGEKNETILLLIYKCLFKCYYKLNNPLTVKYGEKIIYILLQQMELEGVNEFRYYLCLYYIKNKMFEETNRLINYINNESYKTSIIFLLDCIYKRKSEVNYDLLRPFMKLIYCNLNYPSEYRKLYHNISLTEQLALDFNDNIAGYLALNSSEDKYKEILEVYIPNVCKSNNTFDKLFFIIQFCYLCLEFGRYKPFAKAFLEFFGDGVLF